METESQAVWPLIGGLMVIVALIGLVEEDVLPGALRQWLMLGVVLIGFGVLLTWEIRRRLITKVTSAGKSFSQHTGGTNVKPEVTPDP